MTGLLASRNGLIKAPPGRGMSPWGLCPQRAVKRWVLAVLASAYGLQLCAAALPRFAPFDILPPMLAAGQGCMAKAMHPHA